MYRYHHCSRTTYLWDEWTQRHFTRWLESTWTSRPLRLLKKNGPLKTILLVLRCSPCWKIPRVFDANEQNFATSQLIFSYSARDPPWRFAISMQHSEQWNGSASRLPLEDTWHIIYIHIMFHHFSMLILLDPTDMFVFCLHIPLYNDIHCYGWGRLLPRSCQGLPISSFFTVSELFSREIAKRGYTVRSWNLLERFGKTRHGIAGGDW